MRTSTVVKRLEFLASQAEAGAVRSELRRAIEAICAAQLEPVVGTDTLTCELLRLWYSEDLPKNNGLTSIPIEWTWARYVGWCVARGQNPEVRTLHEALRRMVRAERAEFVQHSRTEPIADDRMRFVTWGAHGEAFLWWRLVG